MAEVRFCIDIAEILWAERMHYRACLKSRKGGSEEDYFLVLVGFDSELFPVLFNRLLKHACQTTFADFNKTFEFPELSSPLTYKNRCSIWEHQLRFLALQKMIWNAINNPKRHEKIRDTFATNISALETISLKVIQCLQELDSIP